MIDKANISIQRSNRRTVSLRISPDGSILVQAPTLMPTIFIDAFIRQHEEWIRKKISTLQPALKVKKKQFVEGEEFLYLGIPHTLTIGSYSQILVKDNILYFPRVLQFRIQKELSQWYIQQAKDIIHQHLSWNAKTMDVKYKEVYFSDTKSKWGSCSHDNTLQFNWRLIMAPRLVLNYVVVHELAHIKEKNHSQHFWKHVELASPSYKQHRKWLKTYGATLVL